MKRFVVGASIGFFTVMGSVPATAQQGVRVAYLDTQAILKQTPEYVQAESTFTREMDTLGTDVRKLRASLDSLASDFDRQSTALSPAQREARRKDLLGQQQKFEQRSREVQQRAAARQRELLEPIEARVNSVIEGVRAAGNYAIIFDVSASSSGIVTADKSLDLTERVVQQLKAGS